MGFRCGIVACRNVGKRPFSMRDPKRRGAGANYPLHHREMGSVAVPDDARQIAAIAKRRRK